MNRLKTFLITGALLIGSSALASAQDNYKAGFAVQVRLGGHDGDDRRGFYKHGDGDHDRDDRSYNRDRDDRFFNHDRDDRSYNRDGDDHYRRVVYSDHRWLDEQGRMCYDPAFWRFDVRFGWVRR